MPRAHRARRARRPARRHRRRALGLTAARPMRSLVAKTYNFQFNLKPQIFRAVQTTGSTAVAFAPSPGAGAVPMLTYSTAASSTGFPGFLDVGMACPFALSDIGNIGPWRNMFDAYRINSIELTIEYLNNESNVTSLGLMPTIWMYADQDDALPPTTVTDIVGKQGVKMFQFGDRARSKVSYKLTPYLQNVVTTSAGPQSVAINKSKQWCNSQPGTAGYAGATHFGLKLWIADIYAPQVASVANAFRLNWKYNVSFRSPVAAY